MIAKNLTPAVAYIRMSGDTQEASPGQQRAELKKLAERNNCRIIREYFDEAISGDATEKRLDFQRMIRDAEEKRDFAVILCWDQDRFGRFDTVESGKWIYPLRAAGVWLLTVTRGAIDWNNFTDRIVYNVIQEGKHQFLVDLSRNVLRGKIASAKKGGGATVPPYGFDRVYFDQTGAMVKRVRYGEKFTKPREWRMRFVASEDTEAVGIVRWIFETFDQGEHGIGWIAADLNRRGVVSPQGKTWSIQTVAKILTNKVYTGANKFGDRRQGKYHHMGQSGDISNGSGKNTIGTPIVVDGIHDVLIDRAQFDRVQRKLAGRAKNKQRPRYNGYLLSGVLRCGHCDGPMVGRGLKEKPEYRYYTCVNGCSRPGMCKRYAVRQDRLDAYILDCLNGWLSDDDSHDRIKRAIYRQAKSRTGFKTETAELKTKIEALDRKIAKGTENLLLANPNDMADMSRLLDGWRRERVAIQDRIERMATEPGGRSPDEMAERAVAKLQRLRTQLDSGEPAKVRAAIGAIVEVIPLWFVPNGRTRHKMNYGEIHYQPEFVLFSTGTRGR